MTPDQIYTSIVSQLKDYQKTSKYKQDADERDPRYKAYGVRIPQTREIIKKHKKEILQLSSEARLELAQQLIHSGMGEEQTISFFVLESIVDHFTPKDFNIFDELISNMFGWSKIDGFAGSFMQSILEKYPEETIKLAAKWNRSDNPWKRRASVVLFTRNIAESGRYNDIALELCGNLTQDKHDLVLKAVGWSLKDLLRSDKKRIVNYIKDLRRQKVSSVITLYALRDLSKEERKEILKSNE